MKKILTILIALTLTLTLTHALATATADSGLYVYRSDGTVDTLRMEQVSSISHLRTDLQGRRHGDYVLMAVSLADGSVRRFPLESVDSVVMQRDGERFRLVRFVGGMSTGDGGGARKSLRRTSLDGDFSVSSADGTEFFWVDGDNIFIDTDGGTQAMSDSVFIREGYAVADFFFKTDGVNIPADNVQVYYPGQEAVGYNTVTVKSEQTQQQSNSSTHIGLSGDCGTAVAKKTESGYQFTLDHKASYLCFLPYIANDLGRTVLKSVTVRSDSAIAGEFTLTPDRIVPKQDTTHIVRLTTGDFVLPRMADQMQCSAYMVIAPQNGSTRLTCEFTVYDRELQSTGVYTKTVDLEEVKPNMVYVVKANCNNYVVDLGLPVKFLNHNMGATSPEDYGGYYAYGEVEDKGNYTTGNYAYQNTPYADIPNIRLTDKDVAHVQLGGNFSLPTAAELNMLVDSCTWSSWRTLNGYTGWLITGKNGNTLFMPAGGYRNETSNTEIATRGCYRTSQLVASGALLAPTQKQNWYLNFYSNSQAVGQSGSDVYLGESIRPVISAGVTMTDGTLVQVMTDSVQWSPANPTKATLFGTIYGLSKAKTAVESGFVAGDEPNVTEDNAKATEPAASISTDGLFSVEFDMPKDTAYYIRAYAKDQDGNIEYGNALQFGQRHEVGQYEHRLPSARRGRRLLRLGRDADQEQLHVWQPSVVWEQHVALPRP